jgi:hypothetical protein
VTLAVVYPRSSRVQSLLGAQAVTWVGFRMGTYVTTEERSLAGLREQPAARSSRFPESLR